MLSSFFVELIYENLFIVLPMTLYLCSGGFYALASTPSVLGGVNASSQYISMAYRFRVVFSRLASEEFIFFFFLFVAFFSFFSELIDLLDVFNSNNSLSIFLNSNPWTTFFPELHALPLRISGRADAWFGSDALVDVLTFLLTFLSLVTVISSDDGTSDDRSDSNHSIFLFFLFQILLDCSLSALDLLVFFVAFEMLTIPMFLFFAICGSRDRRMRAFNYFF